MINEYDEIKKLIKKARLLQESAFTNNIAKSVEDDLENKTEEDDVEISVDDVKKEKTKTYRISGGLLSLHGKDEKELILTTEEKTSFQETMDDFVNEVSDLADFGVLNVYKNEVQWSGKIIEANIEFFFTVGEKSGVFINGDMIQLDEKLTSLSTKLTKFFDKFKSKWAKVLGARKKTKLKKEE
jgi:hypothetical protein